MKTETPWRATTGEPLIVEWWVSSLETAARGTS